MAIAPQEPREDSDLCDLVQEDEPYQQLLDGFIDAAVERAATGHGDPLFATGYRDILTRQVLANRRAIDAFQHVSIEKILLRALVLGALKWDPLGLVVAPFERDPRADVRDHREWHARFLASVRPSAVARPAGPELPAAASPALHAPATAAATAESRFLELLAFRRRAFGTDRTVHLSLAPPFSGIASVDPPLRTDLWFWEPGHPDAGVIVECAGFQPHTRHSAPPPSPPPPAVGALRFSGIDIFRDPIAVCSEILGTLH